MYKTIRYFQIIGFILICSAPYALSAPYQLNVSGNRLNADFENMPLSDVIADIGAKTGIQFLFLGGAGAAGYSAPFSLKNESLPIRTVLAKLLSDFNYSLISDGDDNIRQVFILGAKSAAGTGANTRPSFVMAANSGNSDSQISDVNSSVEGMKVTPGEGMQITPGEGMQITPGEGMKVTPGEGMKIGPGQGMVIGSPGEGGPPEGMQVGPGEGMQITPGEGMQIGPGEGGSTSEGMQIGPASPDGMNAVPANTEVVAMNYPDTQVKPGPPFRRSGRWGFRKK